VTRFIEQFQIVTTINYNSLTVLHTLKIPVTAAHKIFYDFTSSFLETASEIYLLLTSLPVGEYPTTVTAPTIDP
jgi:hypothetical protein